MSVLAIRVKLEEPKWECFCNFQILELLFMQFLNFKRFSFTSLVQLTQHHYYTKIIYLFLIQSMTTLATRTKTRKNCSSRIIKLSPCSTFCTKSVANTTVLPLHLCSMLHNTQTDFGRNLASWVIKN